MEQKWCEENQKLVERWDKEEQSEFVEMVKSVILHSNKITFEKAEVKEALENQTAKMIFVG